MFDVLVYLYENYGQPGDCPEQPQLARKLGALGFESDEIEQALSWLEGLTWTSQSYQGTQSTLSLRVYSEQEQEQLGADCLGFVSFLEFAGVLPAHMREMVIDRAMAVSTEGPIELEALKIMVLMVFWSLGKEPDALILDELFVEEQDRLIH